MKAENNMYPKDKIVLLFIIASTLISCLSNENKDKRTKTVYIPEVDIYMTTYKREGGDFYVMFDNKKQNIHPSDSIDYLKVKTGGFITIMFDTIQKDCVYVYSQFKLDTVNQVKYNYKFIDNWTWDSEKRKFYDYPDNRIENSRLKPRYKRIYIETKYYKIKLNNKIIKKGDVFGGTGGI